MNLMNLSNFPEFNESNFNFAEAFLNAFDEAFKAIGRVNILIAGRSGVGKSTLINAVFQGNLATTGQGRPVTQNTQEFTKEGMPISIFDTRGLEMADFNRTFDELKSEVDRRSRERDVTKHIHVAWVCVAEDLRRVEPAEVELVNILSDKMPVVVIITKARADQGFSSEVKKLLTKATNVIRVRAIKEVDDEGNVLQPKNLDELVKLTMEVLPDAMKRAFAAVQKVDMEIKKQQAGAIVAGASVAAAGVAVSPIPFSDALAIVPIQIGMLAGISAVFGLPIQQSFLSTLISSVITGGAATLAGRAIVSNLLKFIPGAGTIAGAAISASTASLMTKAFGEAYIAALEMLFIKNKGEIPTLEEIADAFKTEFNR